MVWNSFMKINWTIFYNDHIELLIQFLNSLVQKENIMVLNDRANELTEINLDIIEYIDKTENSANDKVDSILRKYERYQVTLTK